MTQTQPAAPIERLSSRHIQALDGYRGLAFLFVFTRHYSLTNHATGVFLVTAARVGQAGWTGVDLFFVLSGFLITGILLDTRSDPHYFKNFIARRALRIFPLYYGVLFTILALTPLLHNHWRAGHILYFFYLGNVAQNIDGTLTNLPPYFSFVHLWSLSIEEQFYLLWPAVIYLAATPRKVIRICLALSLFGFIARLIIVHAHALHQPFEWAYAELPTHMDGLLYGAITAAALRLYPLEQLRRWARPALIVSGIALLLVFVYVGVNFAYTVSTLVDYPLLAVFFSALLVLALQPGSLSARFGSLSPLRTLGRYSYGLYVYHLIAWPVMGKLLPWYQSHLHSIWGGAALYFVSAFLITLVVAVASYELFERHFLRFKRHFPYDNHNHAVTPK